MNARARLMHEVKVSPRLLTTKQARELDNLRFGDIRSGGQRLDERPKWAMTIKLVRPRPQHLNAVCRFRQSGFNQRGLPDPGLALDQHDPSPSRAGLLDGRLQNH